ncbi:MAG: ACT domain-containing protein [Chloroflexi bacterium]|nr:ACT domain-containing protein [Chloroflexota bacterium]
MEKIKIGGVIKNSNLAKIGIMGIPDRPGVAGAILSALGREGINVEFIVQCIDLNNQDHVVFCVAQDDLEAALDILEGIKPQLGAREVIHEPEAGIVSIFGPDFRERPGIAGAMFNALASVGINILAISTSISTVSCVINAHRLSDAVKVIKETFDMP